MAGPSILACLFFFHSYSTPLCFRRYAASILVIKASFVASLGIYHSVLSSIYHSRLDYSRSEGERANWKWRLQGFWVGFASTNSSAHWMSDCFTFSSLLFSLYVFMLFSDYRWLLCLFLNILELCWTLTNKSILVLIWKCFGFVGYILLNLKNWFASTLQEKWLFDYRNCKDF